MKRVAAADPSESEPRSFQGSVFTDRFDAIFRTGGEKPAAVADERADGRLVEPDEENKHYFHEMSVWNLKNF